MYEGGISIETYSAGAGRDVASMVDNKQLKCTATLPLYIGLNLGKCRFTDEFFRGFATLILWKIKFLGFHGVVLVKTFLLRHQLLM